ncbi:MAG: chromosome segregation protein SMC [Planctomycetota bacterium]
MLKALELAGFKSFADRTRFDFPDGITVIVGPNGSGKSNIVDAMKWVLGSQSAKSLRGKEMSDVIFKGSQTRAPAGSAEVTIVFDNPDGTLPVDAQEVRLTRRVYRSGEGEYLINGQAVRLKDIRDLIRGTGVGIDAYSLIEQGKVDRMLQAGPRDRRAIFEEAAGISRFKAKKVEAERRLARVQSNLTRLGDIVDEVGGRLKSLRNQAGKAEKYRNANDRLRHLRVQIAWNDWVQWSAELDDIQRDLAASNQRKAAAETLRDQLAHRRRDADHQLEAIAVESQRQQETRGSLAAEIAQISGSKSAAKQAADDLRKTAGKLAIRVRGLGDELSRLQIQHDSASELATTARQNLDAAKQHAANIESQQNKLSREVESLRQRRDTISRDHVAASRKVADLETQWIRADGKMNEATRALAGLEKRLQTVQAQCTQAEADAKAALETLATFDGEIETARRDVERFDAEVAATRREVDRRREDLAGLQGRLHGINERAEVLRDLQRRQEGLSGGVRRILEEIRGSDETLKSQVIGLVADCFDADVGIAPLIDAALAGRSQYVVTRGPSLGDRIADATLKINSRVGLIRIDELPKRRPGDRIRLDGLKGVIGRADRLVQCDAEMMPLVHHLLASTWLVESFAVAIGLRRLSGAGLRFVTSAGELIESDGTLVVGPAGGSGDLISRKSQLAEADEEIAHYQFQIETGRRELDRLVATLDDQVARQGRAEQGHRELLTRRAAAAASAQHAQDRHEARRSAAGEVRAEAESARVTQETAAAQCTSLEQQIRDCKHDGETLAGDLAAVDAALGESLATLEAIGNGVMESINRIHQAEQESAAAQANVRAIADQLKTKSEIHRESKSSLRHALQQIDEYRISVIHADDRIASLLWDQETATRRLDELASESERVRADNRDVMQASETATRDASVASEDVMRSTAALDATRLKREGLAQRMLEDYELDLIGEEVPVDLEPLDDRDAAEEEISRLRNQVQRTSNVNMEALEELEDLQQRYDQLHGQYQDLTAAKDSLQRIITRINSDSRRLFTDTLEAIRENFRELYRKSFGGGHADLVLEDSDDPLEAGVEIVATPPGKQSLSNSLLSGGEKALTAVALLMSIFKYRPSPFCVLDEVDAPFDEANIGRFVTVLNEFLDHSKFVIVTHSKKTMTSATTLYGVTMQESGVSKQVSIRFEDASEVEESGEAA